MRLKSRRFLNAVTLLLLAPLGASAQAPATDVPANEPENVLRWPSPWATPGTRLVYDYSTRLQKVRTTGESVITTRATQTLATVAPGQQSWVASDYRFDVDQEVPPEIGEMLRSMVDAMAGRELRVTLDAEGSVSGLDNLAELAPIIRRELQAGVERIEAAQLAALPEKERATWQAEMKPVFARMLAVSGADAHLQNQLLEIPAAFNFPGMGGLAPGETLSYDDVVPNPTGGEAFPAQGTMHLVPPVAGEPTVEFVWELRLHPQRAAPLLWAMVEGLTGQAMSPELRNQLPDSVDFSFVSRYRIDPATGVVHRFERTVTRRILQSRDINTYTMALRAPVAGQAPTP